MRILFVCFLAMLFFASCKKKEDANAAKTFLNVKYGTDAKQAMDVYLPAGRSTTATPVLILIHGGGWTEGSRNDLNVFVMKTDASGNVIDLAALQPDGTFADETESAESE